MKPRHSHESDVTKYDLFGSLEDFIWYRSSSIFTTQSFSTNFFALRIVLLLNLRTISFSYTLLLLPKKEAVLNFSNFFKKIKNYVILQYRHSKIGIKKSKKRRGAPVMERRFNQTPGDTNLSVLGYLTKFGTWLNLRQITTGTPGSDLNRDRLKNIIEGFVLKGFVESRESENPKAKFEYRITDKGKETFIKCVSFDPDIRFVLGIRDKSIEE